MAMLDVESSAKAEKPECMGCELTLAVDAYLHWTKSAQCWDRDELLWYQHWMAEALVRVTSVKSDWIERVLLFTLFAPHYLCRGLQAALA